MKKTIAAVQGQEAVYEARLALVTRVMQMPLRPRYHLERCLSILTQAGRPDEEKIEILTRFIRANTPADVAEVVGLAWLYADRSRPRGARPGEYEGIKQNTPVPLTDTQARIAATCDRTKAMLLEKNRKYGDSALHPKRIFSKASPIEQIKVRIDDKLSRTESAQLDEDEDVVDDLIGYLVLLKVAREVASLSDRSERGS